MGAAGWAPLRTCTHLAVSLFLAFFFCACVCFFVFSFEPLDSGVWAGSCGQAQGAGHSCGLLVSAAAAWVPWPRVSRLIDGEDTRVWHLGVLG